MPYYPYSRQSKQKRHRGSITARMLANLLTVAGVDHVITLDLHVRYSLTLIHSLSLCSRSIDNGVMMTDVFISG